MKALVSALLFIAAAGCATGNVRNTVGEAASADVSLGWAGDDTYRASGSGVPPVGLNDETLKKQRATEAATLMARMRILEEFARARAGDSGDVEAATAAVSQELGDVVTSGKVVKTTFDEDMTSEVVYEVTSPGLRQKVETRP